MTICTSLARPIAKYATKAFQAHYNPNKFSLRVIFRDNWNSFLEFAEEKNIFIPDYAKHEVERMMACGTFDYGFEIYECPECHRVHVICYTCKSRFCPSCGTKMTRDRADFVSNKCLNVNHRHIVFTIDKRLRHYFKDYPELRNCLFQAAWDAMKHTFRKYGNKHSDFIPGVIMTMHTFGRDLKWNPHIHALVTEGGMRDNHKYKRTPYINYESLRKSFMKQLLDRMRDFFPERSKERKEFTKLRSVLYKDNTNGFYVNGPPRKLDDYNGRKQVVQYITRYAGRPAMAQSRISDYDYKKKTITYWYEDHKTEEKVTVTEHIYKFFCKLIQHIAPPQFKMVRYYGLYACCEHKHKKAVKNHKKRHHEPGYNPNATARPKHYRNSLIDTFGVDPLLCTCGTYMEFVDSYIAPRFAGDDEPP